MAANWKYFRDEIVIDQSFADFVSAKTKGLSSDSTLLIACRDCKHDSGYALSVGYNVILVADQYDGAGGLIDTSGLPASEPGINGNTGKSSTGHEPAGTGGQGGIGHTGNNGRNITLFAKRLLNAHLVSKGGKGSKGGTGGYGGAPAKYRDPDQSGGWGYSAPGRGGMGGPGGTGGSGGEVRVVCAGESGTALPLQIETNGGSGGDGGNGGLGAMDYQGRFRASSGGTGPQGQAGQTGQQSVSQVAETEFWSSLLNIIGTDAPEWAQHRMRVGEYRFRAYRNVSPYDTWRGLALDEFETALILDTTLTQA